MKKKILIIGCLGHIGYSLSLYLSKKYNVFGTYNSLKNKNLLKTLKQNKIKVLKVDVANEDLLKNILKKYNFDTCVYAAAIAHDSIAKRNTKKTIEANCLGVINFFENNKNNCKFIYISTGSVFQNIKSSSEKIDEKTKPTPGSLYSVSKRYGELLVENNFINKKISTILRISWVYGPPIVTSYIDVQRGPIPYILTQLFKLNKKKLLFKSGGDFEASFTYINDVCFALEKLIKNKKFEYPVYHLGSGKNYKLLKLVKIINNNYKDKTLKMGKGYYPWTTDSVIRGPLISKLKNKLRTTYSLNKGIKEYISFLKEL